MKPDKNGKLTQITVFLSSFVEHKLSLSLGWDLCRTTICLEWIVNGSLNGSESGFGGKNFLRLSLRSKRFREVREQRIAGRNWFSPHFPRGQNTKNPVLCSQTPRKRLLRRLPAPRHVCLQKNGRRLKRRQYLHFVNFKIEPFSGRLSPFLGNYRVSIIKSN